MGRLSPLVEVLLLRPLFLLVDQTLISQSQSNSPIQDRRSSSLGHPISGAVALAVSLSLMAFLAFK